jgi:hypothetical protein
MWMKGEELPTKREKRIAATTAHTHKKTNKQTKKEVTVEISNCWSSLLAHKQIESWNALFPFVLVPPQIHPLYFAENSS